MLQHSKMSRGERRGPILWPFPSWTPLVWHWMMVWCPNKSTDFSEKQHIDPCVFTPPTKPLTSALLLHDHIKPKVIKQTIHPPAPQWGINCGRVCVCVCIVHLELTQRNNLLSCQTLKFGLQGDFSPRKTTTRSGPPVLQCTASTTIPACSDGILVRQSGQDVYWSISVLLNWFIVAN